MKRIINTILISAVAALSFSCQVKEEISVPMNESIVLDLSSGLTKADHNSTESFVNHIDVFIFEAVSGTPAGGRHYGRYVVNNASSLTLDAKRSDFDQSKKYYVYLIANSVIEESEFAEYTDHNTLLNKLGCFIYNDFGNKGRRIILVAKNTLNISHGNKTFST